MMMYDNGGDGDESMGGEDNGYEWWRLTEVIGGNDHTGAVLDRYY